jgi:hypothetical protein
VLLKPSLTLLRDFAIASVRKWLTGQRLVLTAGFALIVAGILCLCLSGAVFTGWWQGTLDAFGVGFVVGGMVDVLAISGLNQIFAAEDQRQRENNRQAEWILQDRDHKPEFARASDALALLDRSGHRIDPQLRAALLRLAERIRR